MSLWGNNDRANNAPKFEVAAGHKKFNAAVVTSGAGTITANSATANVNASGTSFNNTFINALLQSNTSVALGRIKSVTNTTQVVLYASAAANVVSNGYYYALDGILTGAQAYHNTTPNAFVNNLVEGVYGVSAVEVGLREANGVNNGISPGWVLMKYGEGGIKSMTINAAASANMSNNETITFSNGSVNATANVTTNATGHPVSLTLNSSGNGVFANAGIVVVTANHEKHMFNIVITSNATAIGFTNGDIITGSNGIINTTATITTNATGGISSTTLTNPGLFAAAAANNTVVFGVANSTGGNTTGNVVSTGFAANLAASTNASAVVLSFTLGGRAGRVLSEQLVAMKTMNNTTNTPPFNNV